MIALTPTEKENSTKNQCFQTEKDGLIYLSESAARKFVESEVGESVSKSTFLRWRKYLLEDSTPQKDPSRRNVYPVNELRAIARFGWFVRRKASYMVAHHLMFENLTEIEND